MHYLNRTQQFSDDDADADELPPRPMRYAAYFERELQVRVRAAYQRGLIYGSRRQVALFVTGLILGWLLNAAIGA